MAERPTGFDTLSAEERALVGNPDDYGPALTKPKTAATNEAADGLREYLRADPEMDGVLDDALATERRNTVKRIKKGVDRLYGLLDETEATE